MRTNLVIDDKLMEEALDLGGFRTKREAVEAGLRLLVAVNRQRKIKKLKGKLKWEGNLEKMRKDSK